jgi:hypothetical protein
VELNADREDTNTDNTAQVTINDSVMATMNSINEKPRARLIAAPIAR